MTDHVSAQRGQIMAEIVVALGIALFLVSGLIVGATSAVRTNDQSRMRSKAVGYAQEALELTRKLRDSDWDTFQAKNGLWCLDKAGNWAQAVLTCPVNIDSIFTRGVTFSWNADVLRMDATARVSWQDGGSTHESKLTTFFTQWQ